MKPLRKIASELIGFDRRERRATYILVILLLVLIIIRFSVSGGEDKPLIVEAQPEDKAKVEAEVEEKSQVLFKFNPNTVTHDDLLKLGLTERQASTLINYRNSGAKFYDADDISRVYGLDSSLVAGLRPWININEAKRSYVIRSAGTKDIVKTPITDSHSEAVPVKIDINRCSPVDLEKLPGIGPVLSERILKYRRLLGGFVSVRQLSEVYGIDSATYDQVKNLVTATQDSVARVFLDSCTFTQMAKHPYFGPETARAIIKYRTLMGVPVSVESLIDQRVITAAQAERIAPYVTASGGQSED